MRTLPGELAIFSNGGIWHQHLRHGRKIAEVCDAIGDTHPDNDSDGT